MPEGAEVISSVGDALSLVRAERELAARAPTPEAIRALTAGAREAAIAAGARRGRSTSASSTARSAPRCARSRPARSACTRARCPDGRRSTQAAPREILARAHCHGEPRAVGSFWIGRVNSGADRVLVLDRFGDPVVDASADLVDLGTSGGVRTAVQRNTKRLGPVTVVPTVWVIHGDSLVEVATGDVTDTAEALAADAPGPCVVLVSRRR